MAKYLLLDTALWPSFESVWLTPERKQPLHRVYGAIFLDHRVLSAKPLHSLFPLPGILSPRYPEGSPRSSDHLHETFLFKFILLK